MFLGHKSGQKGEDYNWERTDSPFLPGIFEKMSVGTKTIPEMPDIEGSPTVSLEHFSVYVGAEWNSDLQSFWFEVMEHEQECFIFWVVFSKWLVWTLVQQR